MSHLSIVWNAAPRRTEGSARLHRYDRGLRLTELDHDVAAQPRCTLLAPSDAAFEALGPALHDFLHDPALVEERTDFFEHTVLAGVHAHPDEDRVWRTLHGSTIWLGPGRVRGRYGSARIVCSMLRGNVLMHVVDGLIFPSPACRALLD